VPVKSREEQAALVLLKERDLLTKHSTMLSNAIRGHAAEFGVTGAKGPQKIKELLDRIAGETNVPEPARELLNSQLAAIKVRLAALEAKLMAHHKTDPRSQLLATIPGVGRVSGVTAVTIALKSLPTGGLSPSPPLSGACKHSSKMAIGRSEDRDTLGNPAMRRYHFLVRDPIHVTHPGQRPSMPPAKAGHMIAIDQDRHPRCTALAKRGPSTYGFRARGQRPRPTMTVFQPFPHPVRLS
jgi:transposase